MHFKTILPRWAVGCATAHLFMQAPACCKLNLGNLPIWPKWFGFHQIPPCYHTIGYAELSRQVSTYTRSTRAAAWG